MFFSKKNKQKEEIPENCVPVILSSICTGEKVIGFKNTISGTMEKAVSMKSQKDVEDFCAKYGISKEDIKVIY